MDWNSFKYIEAIATAGTLSKAARQLGIDSSTLSRHLQRVENEFGRRILRKEAANYSTTLEGMEIVQRARDLKAIVESSQAEVNRRVVVTSVESLLNFYLLRKISCFEFQVEFIQSDSNLNLARREADIAIRLGRPETADYIARKLVDIGYGVYRPKKGPLTERKMSEVPWTAHIDDFVDLPDARWMRANVPDAAIPFRTTSYHQMVTLISRGLVWGVLPYYVGDSNEGVCRDKNAASIFTKSAWTVVHRDALIRPEVRRFKDWLVEQVTSDNRAFSGE